MDDKELIAWLRENSSGVFRPASEAADRIVSLLSRNNALVIEHAALLINNNALVEAVDRLVTSIDEDSADEYRMARAEVDRLIGEVNDGTITMSVLRRKAIRNLCR